MPPALCQSFFPYFIRRDTLSDDYVTKPFSPMELIARIKAVLRRYHFGTANGQMPGIGSALVITLPKETGQLPRDQSA